MKIQSLFGTACPRVVIIGVIFVIFIWLLSILVAPLCHSGDFARYEIPIEYVEVASKTKIDQDKLGKRVDVIDETIFDDYKPLHLTDAIHNVPGVYVKRLNGMSGLTTIFIRGARSTDTLLAYNGIPLRDPSDPQASSNPLIGDLLGSGIGKLEILKGASSTVWGSEPLGGVINIIPKLPRKEGFSAGFEYGTNNTFKEEISIQRKEFYVQGTRLDSNGFDHHDDYDSSSTSGLIILDCGDKINMGWDFLFNQTNAMLNEPPVIEGGDLREDKDDENDKREQTLFHQGFTTKVELNDQIQFVNKLGVTDSDRRYAFFPDSDGSDFYSDGTFHGNELILENSLSYRHSDKLTTTIGHQYDRQWYELETLGESDQADLYANDFFVEEKVKIKNVNLLLGIRENTHEQSKHRTVWDLSASCKIPHTGAKLRGHLGTGFRSPSLYELYGAFLTGFGRFEIGNPNLGPERSRSAGIGADWAGNGDTTNVGITFFHNSIRNKIDFIGVGYSNSEGVDTTRGFEAYMEQFLNPSLSLRSSYTFTDGNNLIDVPESVLDGSIRFNRKPIKAYIRGSLVGNHSIMVFNMDDFTVGKMKEEGRFVMDATISYEVRKDMEVYVRAENMLNDHYHEGGYRAPGARVYGGIKWKI